MEVPAHHAGRADLRQAHGHPRRVALPLYPFAAIVDQERLKGALLVNAVNPAVGGVLVVGSSGTGKSTAVRGLAELLPEIDVVAGCPFSCDPARPACPHCRGRDDLQAARRRVRIVDLPLNATEDRLAGSVDIARALREGERALEPGLLAEANRGILYVDEINLLDDHLVDLLLDAAALGVNVVEREGVSIAHPARFLLVGTMNPEEGELRPQIADRLGLEVDVAPVLDARPRAEIMRRREAYASDPDAFAAEWEPRQRELREALARAAELLPRTAVSDRLLLAIARLVVRAGIGSHRADLTVLECAKALAALDGRTAATGDDVVRAAALALGHRLPHDPFSPVPELDERDLRRMLDDVLDVELEVRKKAADPAP